MSKTTLVATLTEPPSAAGAEIRRLSGVAGVLEVRADLCGDLDLDWLRERFAGALLYTLRSAAEGGAFAAGPSARSARILERSAGYDLVDLELDRDCRTELLAAIPAARRIISWHGASEAPRALAARLDRLLGFEARYHKLIATAQKVTDGLGVLGLLASRQGEDAGRADLVIFAGGPAGMWTRVLAPRLGSALTYGAASAVRGAPGQPSIDELIGSYRLPQLGAAERLFAIVGNPVLHSLSPRLHNGAYRALGVPALYVPLQVERFGDFWLDAVETDGFAALGLPLAGLSVTAPFKEAALALSHAASPRAQQIAAANTLVRDAHGAWVADTTDPEGVIGALAYAGIEVRGRRVAVIGCGGAGRAAAFGLKLAGAEVILVNRGATRGQQAARMLGLPFVSSAAFDPGDRRILVHATSLGRAEDPLPLAVERLGAEHTVVDLVYGRQPTPLLEAAAAAGARVIDGREVLVHQALGQFARMTGHTLGPALAYQLLADDGASGDGASGDETAEGTR